MLNRMLNQTELLWLVNGWYNEKSQVRTKELASDREICTRGIIVLLNLYSDENWSAKLNTELNSTAEYIIAPLFI